MSGQVWATRAAAAQDAVRTRHLRRLWTLPGTRLGRTGWPATWREILSIRWDYWWQAHLLDCLVDAQRRAPTRGRRDIIAALLRGVRLRNLTGWTNNYHDDIAWLGLALQRSAAVAGVAKPHAELAIAQQLRAGQGPSGGMRWRVGDDFVNVPATGPAAIFFARRGDVRFAESLTNWIMENLIDPSTGLVFDGARVNPDGSIRTVERHIYSYCQGVLLGACVELAAATGHPRWFEQAERTVRAVAEHLTDAGVLRGHSGGDGGLFTGILTRYLALAATTLPAGGGGSTGGVSTGGAPVVGVPASGGAPAGGGVPVGESVPAVRTAARLVLDSAEAAWRNRGEGPGGPVFGPQWTIPAQPPGPGLAERDLSVQLSGWMLLEAAAELERVNHLP